jgi:FKBP-type peptidyl-prolyl cis-trans isomerase
MKSATLLFGTLLIAKRIDVLALSSFAAPSNMNGLATQTASSSTTTDNSRRKFLASSLLASIFASSSAAIAADESSSTTSEGGFTLYKTPSGLQYIELQEGTGPSPRYGQFCSIHYIAYLKLPDSDKQRFDAADYLIKHGNARTIAGLDEGLHTMKEGGKRRIIIPPKLGFVDSGLGPIPASPFDRNKLSNLLDQMVEQRAGNLIYDVELKGVMDDEADMGYYEDSALTPEAFQTLRDNIQRKAQEALKQRSEEEGQVGEA